MSFIDLIMYLGVTDTLFTVIPAMTALIATLEGQNHSKGFLFSPDIVFLPELSLTQTDNVMLQSRAKYERKSTLESKHGQV